MRNLRAAGLRTKGDAVSYAPCVLTAYIVYHPQDPQRGALDESMRQTRIFSALSSAEGKSIGCSFQCIWALTMFHMVFT